MKRYLIGLLILLSGLTNIGLPASIVQAANSGMTTNSNYTENASRIVDRMVDRYKRAGYSNSTILAMLQNLRTSYEQKKTLNSYAGPRKALIDALVQAIDKATESIKTRYSNITNSGSITVLTGRTMGTGGIRANLPVVCTREYAPVCGIVPGRSYCSDGVCYPGSNVPETTYTNRCELAKAGGILRYTGECKTDKPSTPTCSGDKFFDANCLCPNGDYPREVTQSFGEVAMRYYTCSPVKPVIPTCSGDKLSDQNCLCPNGDYPREVIQSFGEVAMKYYSCKPSTPVTPTCAGTGVFTGNNCICANGSAPRNYYTGDANPPPELWNKFTCEPITPVCPVVSPPMPPAGCDYKEDGTQIVNGCTVPKFKMICASLKPTCSSTGIFTDNNCLCPNGSAPRVSYGEVAFFISQYTCEPMTPLCPTTDIFQLPSTGCVCSSTASPPRQVPMGNMPAGMTPVPSFSCNPIYEGSVL